MHVQFHILIVATYKTPNKRMFGLGQTLEVIGCDNDFVGSYYKVRVISYIGTDHLKVEHYVLKNAAQLPLREKVHFARLRPVPPYRQSPVVMVGEEVDVLIDDGWWHGQVVDYDNESKCYWVFLEVRGEQLQVSSDECRLHQEWVSDRWVV